MSRRIRAQHVWTAETDPQQLEAFVRHATVDVFERRVEITIDFSDLPNRKLARPQKFISRDPAIVAFHRRIHESIRRRIASAEADQAKTEQERAA